MILPRHRRRVAGMRPVHALLLLLALFPLAAIGGVAASSLGFSRAGSSVAPLDPRLILRPHAVPLQGEVGGRTISGSLYPGYPGPNTMLVRLASHAPLVASALEAVISMPGMRMHAVRVRLHAGAVGYRGTVSLPMFGYYKAQLTLISGTGRSSGRAQLLLPLDIDASAHGN